MLRLPNGWYILVYHDVSWEESSFVRHIGGTCPPDVFQDHVRACRNLGELVSVRDGMNRFSSGKVDAPLFSFWFDDGFAGVRKYAAPILEDFGVTGATSVCSRFLERKEFFWRLKLSYLQSVDGGRLLRSRLRKLGFSSGQHIRSFTLDRFDQEVLGIVDTLFDEAVSEPVKQDAFRIFDKADGIAELGRRGWVIANHSAAHYPIGEAHVLDIMIEQFRECEAFLRDLMGQGSDFWVFPFDRNVDTRAIDMLQDVCGDRSLVLVRNRVNFVPTPVNTLFRIEAPVSSRSGIGGVLRDAAEKRDRN